MRVIPFDSPLLRIEAFHIAAHPTFAAVVELLSWAGRYAVVTNHAPSAVEVLVLRGTTEEGSAVYRKPTHVILEGFSNPPYQPVLLPGARKLVTDAGLLPESLPKPFAIGGGGSLAVYQVMEIDSAIFDDGTLVGPDRFGVVKHVRDHRSAVEELLMRIDEGLASGRTLDEILSDFNVASEDSKTQVRRERLIRNIRRNSSFVDYLRRQRKLPANFPR